LHKRLILAVLALFLIVALGNKIHHPTTKEETIDEMVSRIAGDREQLIRAIIQVESSWNPQAISPTGDYGLMQINKRTWQNHYDWDRILEPEYNIIVGMEILDLCLSTRNQNLHLALISYNGSRLYPAKIYKEMKVTAINQSEFRQYLQDTLDSVAIPIEIVETFFHGHDFDEVLKWREQGILGDKIKEFNPECYEKIYKDWRFNVRKR